jgi:hypothetical protein
LYSFSVINSSTTLVQDSITSVFRAIVTVKEDFFTERDTEGRTKGEKVPGKITLGGVIGLPAALAGPVLQEEATFLAGHKGKNGKD